MRLDLAGCGSCGSGQVNQETGKECRVQSRVFQRVQSVDSLKVPQLNVVPRNRSNVRCSVNRDVFCTINQTDGTRR